MKSLQMIAFGIGMLVTAVLAVFIVIELFKNPGGAQAFFTLLLWIAVPLVLTVFAVSGPRFAYPVFVVVVGAVLILFVTTVPMAKSVWEFENANGPISLMVLVGTLVPLVTLGREMPRQAGWLMLITLGGAFASQALSLLFVGQTTTIAEFALVVLAYLVSAGLYVLAGRQQEAASSA